MLPTDSNDGPPISEPDKKMSHLRSQIHDALQWLAFQRELVTGIDLKRAFAATDTLLDAEEALASVRSAPWPDDVGLSYIYADGILQQLVKQQDATETLARELGVPWRHGKSRILSSIRDVRVRTAGHPAHHFRGTPREGATFLVRNSPGAFRVAIGTNFKTGGFATEEIDLRALMDEQNRELSKVLKLVWGEILIRYPDAAMSHWEPWLAREHYPALTLIIHGLD